MYKLQMKQDVGWCKTQPSQQIAARIAIDPK
jgi:hypothetical protein